MNMNSGVFKTTEKGFRAVCPLGAFFPVSFVTDNPAEWSRAKFVYNVILGLTLLAMLIRYMLYDRIPEGAKWSSFFAVIIGSLFLLFAALSFCFSKIVLYRKSVHGAFLGTP